MKQIEDEVTFTLNDKEVSVPKGWTVMQAAQREKVEIPYFCWHPGLTVAGVCRFCMVQVEGRPKLEIACNLPVSEGLVVNTKTDEAKEAHKWALEYHLANHPLDCPICDQAGECGLQDYYMSVGKYQSQMIEKKVLKPKALDVGSELILDTERCILCSRCVRFEDEVTKTGGLGIFDRGDSSIIGTYDEEKIKHQYQENLVDICPVGAFTSKPFRFRQRVWFLKEKESICPGCSTACKISVHANANKQYYYRIKPVFDEEVNGHWMCDVGRQVAEYQNPENRLDYFYRKIDKHLVVCTKEEAISDLSMKLISTKKESIALLVSPQYTCEEYKEFFDFFVNELEVKNIFQWRSKKESIKDFDGLLLRGDRNPNTHGLQDALQAHGIKKEIRNEIDDCLDSNPELLIVLAPENAQAYHHLEKDLETLARGNCVFMLSSLQQVREGNFFDHLIPMVTFAEKKGHYLNHRRKQRFLTSPYKPFVENAMQVGDLIAKLKARVLNH